MCVCCNQGTPSVRVSGSGQQGDCVRPEVAYSDEVGNRAQPGSDGAVYVGPQAMRTAGGDPLGADVAGVITLPPPAILGYDGTLIAPDVDGRIPLPTGGLPPLFGAGLTTLTDGTLIPDTGSWPVPDAQGHVLAGADTDGTTVYVDSNGVLRAPAEHTSIGVDGGTDVAPVGLITIASGMYTTVDSDSVVLINPSSARRMTVSRYVFAVVDLNCPANTLTEVALQADLGAGVQTLRTLNWPVASSGPDIRTQAVVSFVDSTVLAPGDSQRVTMRVQVTKLGTGSDPTLVYARTVCSMFGVTQ